MLWSHLQTQMLLIGVFLAGITLLWNIGNAAPPSCVNLGEVSLHAEAAARRRSQIS